MMVKKMLMVLLNVTRKVFIHTLQIFTDGNKRQKYGNRKGELMIKSILLLASVVLAILFVGLMGIEKKKRGG